MKHSTTYAYLYPIDPLFSLDALAARIRKSSNFRFAWQFYTFDNINPRSPDGVRNAMNYIADTTICHEFLRESFDPMYDKLFSIEHTHTHSLLVPNNGQLANVLASAANDNLGAYSSDWSDASIRGRPKITKLFSTNGEFFEFQLCPGNIDGCVDCAHHNNHLFSTWFYGVAWDWCFVVTWPHTKHLWIGCLTDTD